MKLFKLYIGAVFILMVASLFLPVIKEEANYTISSLEMMHHHAFFITTVAGTNYGRPPLFQDVIILITKIIGQHNVLISARLVSLLSVIITALMSVYLLLELNKSPGFILFSTVCFLSLDLVCYRGWIAYSDPFICALSWMACVLLYLAVEKEYGYQFIVAAIIISFSVLIKSITSYMLFFSLILCLAVFHQNRKRLLTPAAIVSYCIIMAFPFLWDKLTHTDYFVKMLISNVATYSGVIVWKKAVGQIVLLPLLTVLRLAPFSLLALYLIIKKRRIYLTDDKSLSLSCVELVVWFTASFLVFAVYWLSVQQWPMPRYLLPIYPALALVIAHCCYSSIKNYKLFVVFSLTLVLCLKCYTMYSDYQTGIHYRALAMAKIHKLENAPRGTKYCFKTWNDDDEQILHYLYMQSLPNLPHVHDGCFTLLPQEK